MNVERPRLGLARPVEVPAPGTLRTARLLLRPLRESDEAEFVRVAGLSRANLDASSPIHRPGESDLDLFRRQLQLTRQGVETGQGMRLVGLLDATVLVGAFNLNSISRGLDWSADLNCWISTDQLRRGFGAEGIRALVEHALAPLPQGLGLAEVRGWIERENEPSRRLAAGLGFVQAGDERSYLQTGARWALHDLWIRRDA